jgi:uncharacterized protein (TIGR02270 family)
VKTIPSIVAEHAEETAFLFVLRERVAGSSQLGLAALAEFDERIDAHLDGLRAAGPDGANACEGALGAGEAGELFACAVLALESGEPSRLERALSAAPAVEGAELALLRALDWVDLRLADAVLDGLLDSPIAAVRAAALAFAATSRGLATSRLADELRSDAPQLRVAALVAAGRQGALELASASAELQHDPDPRVREHAAWTATLLGVDTGAKALYEIAFSESKRADAALDFALRAFGPRSAAPLLDDLMRDPTHYRRALLGCAAVGDPAVLGWLLERMADPVLGRWAGAAFAAITGVDLAAEKLALSAEDARPAESDDPPPDDADLPAPDPTRVREWLSRRTRELRPGTPLLAGRDKSAPELWQSLREARQTERAAAALELALAVPGGALFDVAAPAFRQRERIEGSPWR